MRLPSISIIILNFNGLKYVEKCLQSVMASDYSSFEVVFVDNNSIDGSAEYVGRKYGADPRFKLIRNAGNYGYSLGNNIGAEQSKGEYLIFLNVDTIVKSDWLRQLLAFLEVHPSVGIAQCKLRMMDALGAIDCAGHYVDWFGISFVRGHGEIDHGQYDIPEAVFGASGAAFCARRRVFQKLGGFDEDFFMLFEEDDLSWRAWLSGHSVFYVPQALVYHKGGAIRSGEGEYFNLYYSRRNRLVSMLKNYQTRNLLRFLPVGMALLFAMTFLTKNKVVYLRAYLSSLAWILSHAKQIVMKRRSVCALRTVTDDYLIANGVLRKPVITEMLRKGY